MKELIKKIFCEIYFKVNGHEYQFGNAYVEKLLDAYVEKLSNNVDEDFIWNFTLFQFNHYEGMVTRFDRIYVNWIYGQSAMRRWKEKTEQQVYFVDRFREKYGIKKELPPISISEHNKIERTSFKTSPNMQLNNCLINDLIEGCVEEDCTNYNDCQEINNLK